MQKHTRIYLEFFDYGEHQDVVIMCECTECNRRCNDIHHDEAERDPVFNEYLKENHIEFIKKHRPDYEIQTPNQS